MSQEAYFFWKSNTPVSVTSRFSACTVLVSVRPPPSFEQVLVCPTRHSRKPPRGLAHSATALCCLPFVKPSIWSNLLWAEPVPWLCFHSSSVPLPAEALWFVWVHRGMLAILTYAQLFMTGHWLFLSVFLVSFSLLFIIPKMVYTKTKDDIAVGVQKSACVWTCIFSWLWSNHLTLHALPHSLLLGVCQQLLKIWV